MKQILILFAHPAFHKSRINKKLVSAVENLGGVTINNLYENYPDFFIDVKREQELLVKHDLIVWHHPFYWYSAPAIIKEWMDLVLEHGFAYGLHGRALEGKWVLSAISTGGQKGVYSKSGKNQFTVNQFLAPFNQSANLCRMKYLPPFVVHGSHILNEADLQHHAANYRKLIVALRDEAINEQDFETIQYINEIL